MLLCASCNRAKSWSCEHCRNWKEFKSIDTCKSCYWASPEKYRHIALIEIRRADVTWQGPEVAQFEKLLKASEKAGRTIQEGIKKAIDKLLE